MTHPSLRNVALFAAAALVLAASAFIPIAPAAAATGNAQTTYCLTSDSENDCSFTSLAQCEATASGGLGVCDAMPAWHERDPYAFDRSQTKSYR